MDPDRWHRLEELFHQATALPRRERAALVERACAGDYDLAADLNGLLHATTVSEGFVEEVLRRARRQR